jgi:hypothetical protein
VARRAESIRPDGYLRALEGLRDRYKAVITDVPIARGASTDNFEQEALAPYQALRVCYGSVLIPYKLQQIVSGLGGIFR